MAEFSFYRKTIKHAAVLAGTQVEVDFDFKNTGEQALFIEDYEVSCDCTKVSLPLDSIPPGSDGRIHVVFDTTEAIGWQYREIELHANTRKKVEKVELQLKVLTP